MKILLASQSPRRKELLQNLGYDYEIVSVYCEEVFPENLKVDEIAGFISKLKADAYQDLKENEVLITADTIVSIENEVLGKPIEKREALEMLKKLSGKMHQVYTGVTLKTLSSSSTKIDVANVEFDIISDEEAEFYIDHFQPFDKAGSYGIQEWLGMAKVKKIEGSFYTIMGLPTHLVYQMLQEIALQ